MGKKSKSQKTSGHYCKVCGEHKAKEKFSGKGHAAHICKACAAKPLAERNEDMAIRKIEGMAFRHLSEAEIKWLRGKMNDSRPEVREAAREAHGIKFPRYNRNMIKKGLTARSLEFFIHGDVWDEYGDEIHVHARFFADNNGALRRIDYGAPEGEQETDIHISQPAALKFLKSVVQQLNAPFWREDLSDAGPDDYDDCDPFTFDDLDYDGDDEDDEESDIEVESDETETASAEDREPIVFLRLALNKGGENTLAFYNQLHDAPQELYWSLIEWFEPEEEYEDDYGEDE
jgi:hypothetical protein